MYFYHLYLAIIKITKCKPTDKENTYWWGIWYQFYDPSELHTDLQYSIKQNLIESLAQNVLCWKPNKWQNPVTYKAQMLEIELLFIIQTICVQWQPCE